MSVKTDVRVISLKQDSERREAFSTRAAGAGVSWRFFDACTVLAPQLTYSEDHVVVRRGRPLSEAELGCYSSHYSVWEEFLASDSNQLIVFEDDVLVDWEYISHICSHDFHSDGIEFIRLGSLALPRSINMGEYLGRYLVNFLGYALGAHAYLLTRAGATKLVELFKVVRGPVDDGMDQSWRSGVPNLALYHFPTLPMSGPSRIGDGRNATYQLPRQLRLRRFLYRLEEKLRSRVYRLWAIMGGGPRVRGVDTRWL